MKFAVGSAFLYAGMTLGTQTNEKSIRGLLKQLHPVKTRFPLIRIGGKNDGGYLVPNDLGEIVACFSPGVAKTASFEEGMIERNIPCFLADASVDGPPTSHPLMKFEKKYLGVVNNEDFMTLDSWLRREAPVTGDLLLQMDIEGAEWPVLLNVSDETLNRFRVIVVELHDLDRLFDKVGFTLIGYALQRLLQNFHIVHNHPNNGDGVLRKRDIIVPRVLEATFLRKDRAPAVGYVTDFPHPLDRSNHPIGPDIPLPRIWYHSIHQ